MACKANTLIQRVRRKLNRMDHRVVMRDDFSRLGGYVQVGRVLRVMTDSRELVRLGYGLYARTVQDDSGERIVMDSFESLASEAFARIGVEIDGYTKQSSNELTAHTTQAISRHLSLYNKHIHYKIYHDKVAFSESLKKSKLKHQHESRKKQLTDNVMTEDVGFLSSDAVKRATVDLTRGFKR